MGELKKLKKMCDVITYTRLQVYEYDPTRTLTLRNRFVRDMNRRFRELIKIIREAIIDRDVFGLQKITALQELVPPAPGEFNFPRTADKVEAFMSWLRRQIDRGLLETREFTRIGESAEAAWTNIYIYDSYKRGVMRARYEMNKAGYTIPPVDEVGGIEALMSTPFHVDRVGLAYTRTFTDLQGITSQMDTQISRVLAQGLVDGDNPRLLARKIVAVINGEGVGDLAIRDSLGRFIPAQRRAQTLARTEVIRAHHQATIQEYQNWQIQGVQVQAEWSTAGDDRVCDQCAGYEGNIYSLEEVRNMIPVHPNCRCIALPVNVRDL